MAQPFVVSYKIIGDASSGVAAAEEERRALQSVANTAAQSAASLKANTANIAAQFQDIGVQAFSGASPLQIALQQGTQLSAVLGTAGAAGAAGALKGALLSLVSPVSLLTIGTIALGTAAVQWIGSLLDGEAETEDALEAHSKWLKEILHGYEAAGEAAGAAVERARTLPRGVVLSDLGASLAEQEEAARAVQSEVARLTEEYEQLQAVQRRILTQVGEAAADDPLYGSPEDQADLQRYVSLLYELGVSTGSTREELLAATVAARELYNETKDPALRQAAASAYDLATNLLTVQDQAYAARAAIAALNNGALLDEVTAAAERSAAAIEEIVRLRPELRSAREQARDALNDALGSGDALERAAALKAYEETIAAIDEADRRAEARRSETESARIARQVTDYERAIESLHDQTAAREADLAAVGLSTEASVALRTQMELENAARKDSVGLSEERRAQIALEAEAAGRLAAELERVNAIYEVGKEITAGFVRDTVAAFTDLNFTMDEAKKIAGDFFSTLASKAEESLASGLWDLIWSLLRGSVTGLPTASSLGQSGLFGWEFLPGNAEGTDNWRGGLTRINERGGEIIDLPSGTRIIPHDVSMAMAKGDGASPSLSYAPTYSFPSGVSREDALAIMTEHDRIFLERLNARFPGAVRDVVANPRDSGRSYF